jgi:electron transfer flavoprotein alpha subunit
MCRLSHPGQADEIVAIPTTIEEDMATGVAQWTDTRHPPILLTGSTARGREVASRVAAAPAPD